MTSRVKQVRLLRKMKLSDLSTASGVPKSTLSEIEHGAEPRVLTAIRIAKALNIAVERLWKE